MNLLLVASRPLHRGRAECVAVPALPLASLRVVRDAPVRTIRENVLFRRSLSGRGRLALRFA